VGTMTTPVDRSPRTNRRSSGRRRVRLRVEIRDRLHGRIARVLEQRLDLLQGAPHRLVPRGGDGQVLPVSEPGERDGVVRHLVMLGPELTDRLAELLANLSERLPGDAGLHELVCCGHGHALLISANRSRYSVRTVRISSAMTGSDWSRAFVRSCGPAGTSCRNEEGGGAPNHRPHAGWYR